MVSSKEAGIFPTALMASPAASLAWPYKSCTPPSACGIWPRTCVLASPVARPKTSSTFPPRFLAVPLNRFSSMVMLQQFGYIRLSRWTLQRCRARFYAHGDQALLSNRSSTVEVDGLFTEHHAQFRETIRNGKVAPLTDLHYSVTMEGLPIAPTHATKKKADTKRYDRRCVRT